MSKQEYYDLQKELNDFDERTDNLYSFGNISPSEYKSRQIIASNKRRKLFRLAEENNINKEVA
jgi:hypothetical protein